MLWDFCFGRLVLDIANVYIIEGGAGSWLEGSFIEAVCMPGDVSMELPGFDGLFDFLDPLVGRVLVVASKDELAIPFFLDCKTVPLLLHVPRFLLLLEQGNAFDFLKTDMLILAVFVKFLFVVLEL